MHVLTNQNMSCNSPLPGVRGSLGSEEDRARIASDWVSPQPTYTQLMLAGAVAAVDYASDLHTPTHEREKRKAADTLQYAEAGNQSEIDASSILPR